MSSPIRTRALILAAKRGWWVLFFCLVSGLAFAVPPAAPSNLNTLSVSTTNIAIYWQDNSNNEDGFEIERSLSASGPFTQIHKNGADFYLYLDVGLSNATIYYYRVRAYNADGKSGYSNIAMEKTAGAPNSPPTITVQPQDKTVKLGSSVTFNITATGTAPLIYQWQKKAASAGAFTNISGATKASYTFTPLASDNGTQFRCIVTNIAGSITSTPATLTLQTVDNIPPTGAIKINNDAQYTNSTSLTLNLSTQDNPGGSGVSSMQFSNNNSTWSNPEAYAATKAWTLLPGDGIKTVYVKFKDGAGNWSIVYSDSITLDTTAPITPMLTDDGATTPYSTRLHCRWSSSDNVSGIAEYQYKINQDSPSGLIITNWTSIGTATEVTKLNLSLTNNKTYYFSVKARNGAGLWSGVGYSDGIKVVLSSDITPPTGTIKINNDSSYTGSMSVTLNLSANDNTGGSGMNKMRLSNDNANWSNPEAYAATKAWTLLPGDGIKTVYVKFSDKSGNWSQPFSDTIILNTVAPKITAISPTDGSTFLEGATVVISATVNNPNPATLEYQFSIDGVIKQDWLRQSSYSWTATPGIHKIKVGVKNISGQDTKEAEVYVYIKPIEPPKLN